MRRHSSARKHRRFFLVAALLGLIGLIKTKLFMGFVLGVLAVLTGNRVLQETSTDRFCGICHVHPHVETSWLQSTHVANASGVKVHCVECHLPPEGWAYIREKARLGIRDAYGYAFKDHESFNWEAKSTLEHAKTYTFKESCLHCHDNLFPLDLSTKGEDAHLYYTQHAEELRCINCHLHVGHYDPDAEAADFGLVSGQDTVYRSPARPVRFENFTETLPGTGVAFDMVAVPGGTFKMGSAGDASYRNADEPVLRPVRVDSFWIGRTEFTWAMYEAFYQANLVEGRSDTRRDEGVDAITGPTPLYGSPDQGWGRGDMPAITMTHFAATRFCEWLSEITGKTYRLPTEAEWEYACRGGTETPYFFPGTPGEYTSTRFWNRLFGPDTSIIGRYAVYSATGEGRTETPDGVAPNPLGLVHMTGNVREFCLDYYSADPFADWPEQSEPDNPRGPETGSEYVVRGGSFQSDAIQLRSAARDHTRHDAWLLTDPQMPKSYWWYSDCVDVGFRIVCEPGGNAIVSEKP